MCHRPILVLVESPLQPQVVFALVGLIHVTLWDGRGGKRCWRLEPGGAGLYIGPMLWLEFASQCVHSPDIRHGTLECL